MEEQTAHELYQLFQQVDKGAKQKQGLGFGGGGGGEGGGRREFADQDDVIRRNQRLYGTAPREDGDAGYDSDSATAVVRRLKQLKKEQGKAVEGAAVAEAARRAAQRESSRASDSSRGGRELGYSRERGAGSRGREEERQHGSSRGREEERWHGGSRDWDEDRGRGEDRLHHWSGREQDRDEDRSHHRRSRDDYDDDRHHSSRDRTGFDRSKSYRRDRSRSRSRSPRRSRPGEQQQRQHGQRQQAPGQQKHATKQAQKLDFEKLIPGFSSMSAAQKLKARTQYLLERSSQRDQRHAGRDQGGPEGQWTRFAFDQSAYLDEEGGRPMDGLEEGREGPGGRAGAGSPGRGIGLSRVNAVTFKQSVVEAELAGRDASHEAAIFGRGLPAVHAAPAAAPRAAAQQAPPQRQWRQQQPLGSPGASAAAARDSFGADGVPFAGLGSSSSEQQTGHGEGAALEEPGVWGAGWSLGNVGVEAVVEGDDEEAPVVVLDADLRRAAGGKQLGWRERAAQLRAQRAKQP